MRILSGLYGVMRPLDLMQAYRLDMGTRLPTSRGKDLYAFWGARVTEALGSAMQEHRHQALINLASEEYFKVVRPELLRQPVITPVFEDWMGGKFFFFFFFVLLVCGLLVCFVVLVVFVFF